MPEATKVDWDNLPIDSDKQPPKMKRLGRARSKVTQAIERLQPGQSFVIPKRAAPNVRVRFRQVHGKNAYREVEETPDSVRFFRKEPQTTATTE